MLHKCTLKLICDCVGLRLRVYKTEGLVNLETNILLWSPLVRMIVHMSWIPMSIPRYLIKTKEIRVDNQVISLSMKNKLSRNERKKQT